MTATEKSRPNPEELAQRLTELEDQLRLSIWPAGGSLLAHPALGRLESAARLLGELETGDPGSGWKQLAAAASRFAATARAHPDRLPTAWGSGVERAARNLESVLAELDRGLDVRHAADRVAPAAWPAGGEDAPRSELEQWKATLAAWEQEGLPVAGDETLRNRAGLWREIRDRGDALFRAPLTRTSRPRGSEQLADAGLQLGLLLASPFQRQQLAERLADLDVLHFFDPDEMAVWLEQGPQRAVLLADNLEPSRHLERLLERLGSLPHAGLERCLLVAGALAPARPQGRRSLPAGVDGVWTPPYTLDDLNTLIRGS